MHKVPFSVSSNLRFRFRDLSLSTLPSHLFKFSNSQRVIRIQPPVFRVQSSTLGTRVLFLAERGGTRTHLAPSLVLFLKNLMSDFPSTGGIYCLTHSLSADPLPISNIVREKKITLPRFEMQKSFEPPVLDLSSFSLPPPLFGQVDVGHTHLGYTGRCGDSSTSSV